MKNHVSLDALVASLDTLLQPGKFHDSSHNGLQVASRQTRITNVCLGVDASLPLFQDAVKMGAQLVICHHGLSWGDSMARLTGLTFEQTAFLIEHRLALYACHLPLDAHPSLGNNAQLAKLLKLRRVSPFLRYHGGPEIGAKGELPKAMSLGQFARAVAKGVGCHDTTLYPFGKKSVRTVGIVSGGAADEIRQAHAEGLDVYLSGESNLNSYVFAQQAGMNAVFAGHYATETFGVRALGGHLRKTFGISTEFVDYKIPF